MNRVIHFEIHAANPERAAGFYRDVFGWEIKEWVIPGAQLKYGNRYWLVTTGPDKEPGINGGLLFRKGVPPKGGEPVTSYICTIQVPSVDDYIKRIESAGGKNVVPRMAIPGLAWLAYCTDPEGNIFGIYEDDKSAQ